VRRVRLMLQEVAQRRGRPLLLVGAGGPDARRLPLRRAGCRELGAAEPGGPYRDGHPGDGPGRVRLSPAGGREPRPIYPCVDGYHTTDGYAQPPIEFFRGLAAKWWQQGVDGIVTFNFCNESPEMGRLIGRVVFGPHQQAYHEIGDPNTLRFKDKVFVLQRRGGYGNLDQMYENGNHEAPLPVALTGPFPSFLESIYIPDDVAANPDRVARCELRLLLQRYSDNKPVDLPANLTFNGISLVDPGRQAEGWRVFKLSPRDFAVGPNLITAALSGQPAAGVVVQIAKLEVHIGYRP